MSIGAFIIFALAGIGAADALLMKDALWLPAYLVRGIEPEQGPSLAGVLQELDLIAIESDTAREQSLLVRTVPDAELPHTSALLLNNDRLALFIWVQSPHVKEYFTALRTALLQSFSPQVRNLKDETRNEAGKPIRTILRFSDPAISEDQIALVRIQDRLYELHIAKGQEQLADQLIDKLTE